MTPAQPDAATISRRLRLIEEAVVSLSALSAATVDDLSANPLDRAAAERLLQVMTDLAVDINAHLAVALLGRAPETGRESFTALAEAGVLDEELAGRMAPVAGLRNILVHNYVDVRLDLVVDSISDALRDFPRYLEAVAAHVKPEAT